MKNIDWKRKLSSRKFWACVIGFVTPILLAFGVSNTMVTQITGIIMAGAALIAYILAEGFIDAASAKNASKDSIEETKEA